MSWRQTLQSYFQSAWAPLMVIGMVILLVTLHQLFVLHRETAVQIPEVDYQPLITDIEQRLSELFAAHEIPYEKKGAPGKPASWLVRLPADVPPSDIHTAVKKGLRSLDTEILSSASDPVSGRLSLVIGSKDSSLMRLVFHRDARKRRLGRIAVLIDDFGDRNDAFSHSFFDLPGKITISVIPGRGQSSAIARVAENRGCEVMLHMPMEPIKGAYFKDEFTIVSEMTEDQVRRIFKKAAQQIPGMSGFNNHMGSRVTSDRRIMHYLMESVRETDYFFVDSRTTAETVAYDIAASLGIRCAKRDVFLDDQNDQAHIRQQMQALAEQAEHRGYAVGIGHCTRNMLEVLREEIPKLQEKGFRFVKISDVVR